jgi:HTH-type transcriptional regulator / antitoxin HigA
VSTVNYMGKAKDRYLELIRRFPLRPLRCDEDLDTAVAMIDSLLSQPSLKREEQDYLEVLGDLVEAYETESHPLGPVSDADLLSHLIEARGVSQSVVAGATGIAVSTISEVLRGKRTLNRAHIGKLARYFHVSPDTFVF